MMMFNQLTKHDSRQNGDTVFNPYQNKVGDGRAFAFVYVWPAGRRQMFIAYMVMTLDECLRTAAL